MIILFVVLGYGVGCQSANSDGPIPLQAYPPLPMAVNEPDKVWIRCGTFGGHPDAVESEMFCVDESHVLALKQYLQKLDSMVRKYEYAIEQINSN